MSQFFHINSIAQVHEMFNLGKPIHPLVTIIREWPKVDFGFSDLKISSDLYFISMKGDIKGTFKYGRNSYDYEEGSMVFIAPSQVASFEQSVVEMDNAGFSLLFHPDLIRKSELRNKIKDFSFFNYESNEALHLSEKEKQFLMELIGKIEIEMNQNIDKHSQDIMIQAIETILMYSNRYYDRQFYTRTNINKDIVVKFEKFLEEYFSSEELAEKGIPTLSQCGEALSLSGSYLSDLLKAETNRSAKDHLHSFIINKAKNILLNSTSTINEVAYGLGFEYSQHFSKLFKNKTGMSPSEYRGKK